MGKIEEYLKSGSSNCPPGEAFQALDIVLKNRPFALRLVISKSSDNNIFCIIQLKKKFNSKTFFSYHDNIPIGKSPGLL